MRAKQKKNSAAFRIAVIGGVFGFFMAVIAVRAVYIQAFCNEILSEKAANQYKKLMISRGKRGTIFDRNYKEMAITVDVASIAAYPGQMEGMPQIAKALAKELQINRKELSQKLSSGKTFVWVKRQTTPKETTNIKDLQFSGIDFISEDGRFYPSKTLAAQVLGFSGIDGHGLEGVEFFYDRYLQGEKGEFKIVRDALGRGLNDRKSPEVENGGKNLILTLDSNIQYIAERTLQEAVDSYLGESGTAIVMVPKTGAVLAMAHYPFVNPNAFRSYNRETWRNRAVADSFEPGSTMKIFTAAAAIESGECTPSSVFFAENGEYRIGKHVIHDVHPHGWLTLAEIVKYSSNIGAAKVSQMIGPETLHKTLSGFGFGEKTQIDCPGEVMGNVPPFQRWAKIDSAVIAFGQGISVSAIQLISAVSAIANDGILMKPYMVQGITDKNGRILVGFAPKKVRRAISKETASTLKTIMAAVIEKGGTGAGAALDGYSVSGKTGTAQKADKKGGYAKGRYLSSFVGFAPVENTEIAVLVIIDEPKKAYYGGTVAGPAFKKIAQETLSYLNIPPAGNPDQITVQLKHEATG
ncbi:MAG: cell division protein FtsI [Deltaproteobacteria bacterium RBG_13_49_15]|nr:MAG: cell division protein FtsI [Deltaproteobacteria bacterium RBG_13_49_15]